MNLRKIIAIFSTKALFTILEETLRKKTTHVWLKKKKRFYGQWALVKI